MIADYLIAIKYAGQHFHAGRLTATTIDVQSMVGYLVDLVFNEEGMTALLILLVTCVNWHFVNKRIADCTITMTLKATVIDETKTLSVTV